jgi:catechol 2,3-dioxygenase-like lactoylglutathione lyase family enzyme
MSDHWYSRPILYAADIQRMLDFYLGKLGFKEDWRYEEEGQLLIAQVGRNGCELIFTRQPEMHAGPGRIFISLDPEELEASRRDLEARGVPIREGQWGYRTMIVTDPDNNELFFPYPLESGS